LLQENGYPVLRFLAEDVGRELDMTLDATFRAVGHRRVAAPPLEPMERTHCRPFLVGRQPPSCSCAKNRSRGFGDRQSERRG
jgi:hypothetical protein